MTTQAMAGPRPQAHRQRDSAEKLLDYADFLQRADRALLRAIFDRGLSATQFARATHQPPRSVRKRVQRLVQRVGSTPYQFVLRNRYAWSTARRQVAESIFLRGLTQRQAAARLGLSLHHVRQEIERVRVLYECQL